MCTRFVFRCLLLVLCGVICHTSACIPVFDCIGDTDCPLIGQRCRLGNCINRTPTILTEPVGDGAVLDRSITPVQDTPTARDSQREPTSEPVVDRVPDAPRPEAVREQPPEPRNTCQHGDTRACYTFGKGCTRNGTSYDCKGTCKTGREACINGKWSGNCGGEIPPVQELVDGKDNDCDGKTDETARCLPTKHIYTYKHDSIVTMARFHPFDKVVALGTSKGVLMWDLISPDQPPRRRTDKLLTPSKVMSLAYINRNPIRLVYGTEKDKWIKVRDIDAGTTRTWLSTTPIHSLDFANASGYLYAGGADGNVFRWVHSTGKSQKLFGKSNPTGETNAIFRLRYVPSTSIPYLLVGRVLKDSKGQELSRRLETWNSANGWKKIRKDIVSGSNGKLVLLADFAHVPNTNGIALSYVLSALFTPDKGTPPDYTRKELLPDKGMSTKYYARSVAAHRRGTWVAVGMSQGEIKLLDWRGTPKVVATIKLPTKAALIERIDWSPQGNYLVATTLTEMHIWTCP